MRRIPIDILARFLVYLLVVPLFPLHDEPFFQRSDFFLYPLDAVLGQQA